MISLLRMKQKQIKIQGVLIHSMKEILSCVRNRNNLVIKINLRINLCLL